MGIPPPPLHKPDPTVKPYTSTELCVLGQHIVGLSYKVISPAQKQDTTSPLQMLLYSAKSNKGMDVGRKRFSSRPWGNARHTNTWPFNNNAHTLTYTHTQ